MHNSTNDPTHEEGLQKLRDLMKDIKFGMLVTAHEGASFRSRPMTLLQTEPNGDMWFLTGKNSSIAEDIGSDSRVNVSFTDSEKSIFVSISGRAGLPDQPEKAKELWNPMYRTWFPKGLEDPNLALLKIDVEGAEYWDSPNGTVTYLFGVLKAIATGKPPTSLGDHQKLDLK